MAEARFVNAIEREPVDVSAVPETRKNLVRAGSRRQDVVTPLTPVDCDVTRLLNHFTPQTLTFYAKNRNLSLFEEHVQTFMHTFFSVQLFISFVSLSQLFISFFLPSVFIYLKANSCLSHSLPANLSLSVTHSPSLVDG